MIYIDHNSTTRVNNYVIDRIGSDIFEAMNPSSVHKAGREARRILEEARERIASSIRTRLLRSGAKITFTSCATEANNLIISNFLDSSIFYSSIEHPSVMEPAKRSKAAHEIRCKIDGIVDLEHLDELLARAQSPRKLVTIMAANNETGIIQPIGEVVHIAKKHGAYVHVDAAQAFGKIDLGFDELGIDFATLSSHKIGGLPGVGALVSKDEFLIDPLIIGGGQERSERSGTENVIGAYSFGFAAEFVARNLVQYTEHTSNLRSYVEGEVMRNHKAQIIGQDVNRLPNTSLIAMRGISSDLQLIRFDSNDIMLSNGSACSSGRVKDSHVLKSMGYDEDIRKSVVRVSFGLSNSLEDAKAFVSVWNLIAN